MALATQVASAHRSVDALTTDFLYADVTYQFSTMYKMPIMTQSRESGKGVVLAIIFVMRLHAAAFKRIFLTFLHNPSLWTLVSGSLVLRFESCLVDFSDSQRSGYLQAIKCLWRDTCSQEFSAEVRHSFAAKLTGCYFHYCQSIRSCSHNSRVVPNGMEEEFKKLALNACTLLSR